MIHQFDIESDDDEYAKPEDIFDDKTRQIEEIKDAGNDELGDGELCLHICLGHSKKVYNKDTHVCHFVSQDAWIQ